MSKRNARANQVEGYDQAKAAGDFFFVQQLGQRIGLIHTCPCGCGQLGAVYWKNPRENPREGGANWTVEGEWPNATLNPSIGFKGGPDSPKGPDGYHWHGYLRAGVFEEC